MIAKERFSRERIGVLAVAFAVAFWQWDAAWLFPLRVLMTLFHELGHGLAAIATGGSIDRIEVFPGGGGLCYTLGGWRWVILPAGYLGSMASGCAIIFLACRTRNDRFVSLALGLFIVGATLLWVRTMGGFAYGLATGAALASAGWWLTEDINDLLLCLIGAMNAMASLFGLKYLWVHRGLNDAVLFSREILPLPPVVWALAWIALSAACLTATLRVALRKV